MAPNKSHRAIHVAVWVVVALSPNAYAQDGGPPAADTDRTGESAEPPDEGSEPSDEAVEPAEEAAPAPSQPTLQLHKDTDYGTAVMAPVGWTRHLHGVDTIRFYAPDGDANFGVWAYRPAQIDVDRLWKALPGGRRWRVRLWDCVTGPVPDSERRIVSCARTKLKPSKHILVVAIDAEAQKFEAMKANALVVAIADSATAFRTDDDVERASEVRKPWVVRKDLGGYGPIAWTDTVESLSERYELEPFADLTPAHSLPDTEVYLIRDFDGVPFEGGSAIEAPGMFVKIARGHVYQVIVPYSFALQRDDASGRNIVKHATAEIGRPKTTHRKPKRAPALAPLVFTPYPRDDVHVLAAWKAKRGSAMLMVAGYEVYGEPKVRQLVITDNATPPPRP